MTLARVAGELDALLDRKRIADYSNNGLQIEGRPEVRRIAFAVDAGLETIQRAGQASADLLVVHHGLFWNQPLMITGTHRQRVAACIESGISLYAAHLPLDVHPRFGNNAGILEDAGFSVSGRFAEERGLAVGFMGTCEGGRTLGEIQAALEASLGCRPFRILGAPEPEKRYYTAGAITGSGLKYAEEASALGADVYLSGEGSHAAYHQVIECGIVCLLYGHYVSETVGLRRLMAHLVKEWNIECVFLDVPTGF